MPEKKKTAITPKQIKAIALFVQGASMAQVASASNVEEGTVGKWMREKEFSTELERVQKLFRSQVEARITRLGGKSTNNLEDLMDHPDPSIRLKANVGALNATVRLLTRYKELDMTGYVPQPAPLIIFPAGTKQPWSNQGELPVSIGKDTNRIIDVEAVDGSSKDGGEGGSEPGQGATEPESEYSGHPEEDQEAS